MTRFLKVCAERGCSVLLPSGTARCTEHTRAVRREHVNERRRQSGSPTGWAESELKRRLMRRAGGMCEWPGCTRPAVELDHRTPLKFGGRSDPSTCWVICREHHAEKTRAER